MRSAFQECRQQAAYAACTVPSWWAQCLHRFVAMFLPSRTTELLPQKLPYTGLLSLLVSHGAVVHRGLGCAAVCCLA